MNEFLRFLLIGLVLGLFTEAELKLVAGIKPSTFINALLMYPMIISLSYAGSRLLDRVVSSRWKADLVHYIGAGVGGLAIEWTMLGNGPNSNALQFGMFAMWTTFCFGPRVLSRGRVAVAKEPRRFWISFTVVAVLLTGVLMLTSGQNAKVVVAVVGLSVTYSVWSIWLLSMAWRDRQRP